MLLHQAFMCEVHVRSPSLKQSYQVSGLTFPPPALSCGKSQRMVWIGREWMLAKQVSIPFQPLSPPVPKTHRAMGFATRRLLLVGLGAHLCTRCQHCGSVFRIFRGSSLCIFGPLTKSCMQRRRNFASVAKVAFRSLLCAFLDESDALGSPNMHTHPKA